MIHSRQVSVLLPLLSAFLLAACGSASTSAPRHDVLKTAVTMSADQLLSRARDSHGAAYVDAERALLAAPDAAPVLARLAASNAEAIEKLWAACLREISEGKAPQYNEALVIMNGLGRNIPAHTPLPSPSPEMIAHQLSVRLGDRPALFLSVRLLKGTDWPHWKKAGVLLYLTRNPRPETAAPLVRFAATTEDPSLRELAVAAARAANAPALSALLAAEKERVAQLRQPWPAELQAAMDAPAP